MQLEKIPLADTRSFSPFFLDYINGTESLKPFYTLFPAVENFGAQLQAKSSFPESSRRVLSETLQRQYKDLPASDRVRENLKALESKTTFTITTGHQQNIFTGPLYFIFKIVTVINACKALASRYPEYRFVPVYWMASEDHDFEEISYFRLYGKKYTWTTNQTGAVGRFNPAELKSLLGDLPGDVSVFREAYLKQKTLSNAVRAYVNSLFGGEGLVVVDADDRALKKQLMPAAKADLFDHLPFQQVEKNTQQLKALGYHTQVNAREINFFYLDGGLRERIETEGTGFKVVNQDIRFTLDEMLRIMDQEPEKLSPNVVPRPLYQELILPNLAYVGGPSELVYWLQLRGMFDHFAVPFPILMPRNFGMVLDHTLLRKFEKTGLVIKDLFEDKNYLFNHWMLANASQTLTLGAEIRKVQDAFDRVKQLAGEIDPTLTAHTEAKSKQAIHQLEVIEKKMLRAEKRKHAEKLGQIEAVKDSVFPGGSLQERTDNFLNFQQQNPEFIRDLIGAFDPFDYRMHIVKYND